MNPSSTPLITHALSLRQPWAWAVIRPDLTKESRALAPGSVVPLKICERCGEYVLEPRDFCEKCDWPKVYFCDVDPMELQFKTIENRNWTTKRRGRVFIHASKTWGRDEIETLEIVRKKWPHLPWPDPGGYDLGGIIGSVKIVDCVKHSASKWFFGEYGFVLKRARVIDFIPERGMMGFFPVTQTVHQVLEGRRK